MGFAIMSKIAPNRRKGTAASTCAIARRVKVPMAQPEAPPVVAPNAPRRRIICNAKDIPSAMEQLAASWKK